MSERDDYLESITYPVEPAEGAGREEIRPAKPGEAGAVVIRLDGQTAIVSAKGAKAGAIVELIRKALAGRGKA